MARQVLAQEISGTAALSLESEEFKLKKRKLDKDARVLAQISNGPMASLSSKGHSPSDFGAVGAAAPSRGRLEGGGRSGRGGTGKGSKRGCGADDDVLSTHSTDGVGDDCVTRSSSSRPAKRQRGGSKGGKVVVSPGSCAGRSPDTSLDAGNSSLDSPASARGSFNRRKVGANHVEGAGILLRLG